MNRRYTGLLVAAALGVAGLTVPAAVDGLGACDAEAYDATADGSSVDSPADDPERVIHLHSRPPYRGYFQYEDGQDGPPPEVGHWTRKLPVERELPQDPDHLIPGAADPSLVSDPVFAGRVVGELSRISVQIARGHMGDSDTAQATLRMRLEVDGVELLADNVPVMNDDGSLSLCHIAHLGMYYAVLTDVDVAMEQAGLENTETTEHFVVFSFAPTAEQGAPPVELFGIDSQAAPSGLDFGTARRPGPKYSLVAGPEVF